MTFQTFDYNLRTPKELDFRLIKTSKNNLIEIHIPRPMPWDSPFVSLFSLGLSEDGHGGINRLASRSFFFSQKSKMAVHHPMNWKVYQKKSVMSGKSLVVGYISVKHK